MWFEFLIRLGGFAVTFYFLLEYVLTCKVSTNIGIVLTFFTMIVVFIIFKSYTCNKVSKCEACQSTITTTKSLRFM
jgi:hypothetical protein